MFNVVKYFAQNFPRYCFIRCNGFRIIALSQYNYREIKTLKGKLLCFDIAKCGALVLYTLGKRTIEVYPASGFGAFCLRLKGTERY